MRDAGSLSNRISAFLLYIVVAGAPLLFGSTSPLAGAFWCAVAGIALILAVPRNLRAGHFVALGTIALIVLAYAFVLHEQLSTRPWFARPNDIWARASGALGVTLAPSVSVVRNEPLFALGAPLAAILVLTCSLVLGTGTTYAKRLLQVIAWSGAVYAIYGILALVFTPSMILWSEKPGYFSSLTATFINRNNAATYFGSVSIVWLLLLLRQIRSQLPPGMIVWNELLDHFTWRRLPREVLISFAMFFVCFVATFLTISRGGILLSLFGMVVATFLYLGAYIDRRRTYWILAAAVVLIALVFAQVMGGMVGARIENQGLADAGRIEAYRSAFRMIVDHPWFGTGLGTFAMSFAAYRSPTISAFGVWDIAHNTPLELAVELGAPLAMLVVSAWLATLLVLLRGTKNPAADRLIPLSAFAVSVVAVLHSLVDFPLQIPGYSLVAFALVGAGLAQSLRGGRNEARKT